jgi:hypothetical protein
MSKMQEGLLLILVKQFYFIPLFIFKISKIFFLKFESKINYLWKQLKWYLPSIEMKPSYIMKL